jgi:hypothetical protein
MGSINTTSDTPVRTVGYIGLGKAGASMASNIPRAGFTLIVRDAEPEREQAFVKQHGAKNTKIADPGPAGFKDVDVLVTMLPQGKVVRQVLLGEGGIAQSLKPGMLSLFCPALSRCRGSRNKGQGYPNIIQCGQTWTYRFAPVTGRHDCDRHLVFVAI